MFTENQTLIVYKTYIQPIGQYAALIYGYANTTDFSNIYNQQKLIRRNCYILRKADSF